MPDTRGSLNKRKPSIWHHDPDLQRLTTTSDHGIAHTHTLGEIQSILHSTFGGAFFPSERRRQARCWY